MYYRVLPYQIALLEGIREELSRIMENITQEEYADPFGNSGNVEGFKNDTFEVHAYDWGDDNQEFNFKWGEVEVTWYKYLGRGTYVNKKLTADEWVEMFNRCMYSLSKYEDEHDNMFKIPTTYEYFVNPEV